MTTSKRSAVMCAVKVPLTIVVEGRVTKAKIAAAAQTAILAGEVSNIDLDEKDVCDGYAVDGDFPG